MQIWGSDMNLEFRSQIIRYKKEKEEEVAWKLPLGNARQLRFNDNNTG